MEHFLTGDMHHLYHPPNAEEHCMGEHKEHNPANRNVRKMRIFKPKQINLLTSFEVCFKSTQVPSSATALGQ